MDFEYPKPDSCQETALPFRKRHMLDSPNLKKFADNNFKFVENIRKYFLLFPQCFQKTWTADM